MLGLIQEPHQTALRDKKLYNLNVVTSEYYFFLQVACLQKLHQTQQSEKVTAASKAGIETISLYHLSANADSWSFLGGEIQRCIISPWRDSTHHQIFLSITIHHSVEMAE